MHNKILRFGHLKIVLLRERAERVSGLALLVGYRGHSIRIRRPFFGQDSIGQKPVNQKPAFYFYTFGSFDRSLL